MLFFKNRSINELKLSLPREELVRRSRILVIDDQKPELINDLKSAHFSVDYVDDITASTIDTIEKPLYDLILLDFGEVGKSFGDDHGLSLLRHIKRVNPAIIVLTYTSMALQTKHSDFYRLADGTLAKDAGIQESLERIEVGLRKAHTIENVWNGLIMLSGIDKGSAKDAELQNLYVKGLSNPKKFEKLKEATLNLVSGGAKTVASTLISKLIELGVQSTLG
jgi:CheY-like chemotaxis protein